MGFAADAELASRSCRRRAKSAAADWVSCFVCDVKQLSTDSAGGHQSIDSHKVVTGGVFVFVGRSWVESRVVGTRPPLLRLPWVSPRGHAWESPSGPKVERCVVSYVSERCSLQ